MTRDAAPAGTSLIEVLIAMALVILLVVGSAEMMTLALRAKRRGDVLAAITRAVGDRFESLKARPFDAPELVPGAYAATVPFEPGGRLAETWEIADDGDGLKLIRLTVRPSGSAGQETVAVLFVSRDLGFRP